MFITQGDMFYPERYVCNPIREFGLIETLTRAERMHVGTDPVSVRTGRQDEICYAVCRPNWQRGGQTRGLSESSLRFAEPKAYTIQ